MECNTMGNVPWFGVIVTSSHPAFSRIAQEVETFAWKHDISKLLLSNRLRQQIASASLLVIIIADEIVGLERPCFSRSAC